MEQVVVPVSRTFLPATATGRGDRRSRWLIGSLPRIWKKSFHPARQPSWKIHAKRPPNLHLVRAHSSICLVAPMSIPEDQPPPPSRPHDQQAPWHHRHHDGAPPPPWCRRRCKGFKIGLVLLLVAVGAFLYWHCPCHRHRLWARPHHGDYYRGEDEVDFYSRRRYHEDDEDERRPSHDHFHRRKHRDVDDDDEFAPPTCTRRRHHSNDGRRRRDEDDVDHHDSHRRCDHHHHGHHSHRRCRHLHHDDDEDDVYHPNHHHHCHHRHHHCHHRHHHCHHDEDNDKPVAKNTSNHEAMASVHVPGDVSLLTHPVRVISSNLHSLPYVNMDSWVPPTVTLNVGGTRFETLNTTLLQCSGSLFHSLLEAKPQHGYWHGNNFVDWSPRLFEHVLRGLRAKSFGFRVKLSADDQEELQELLDFLRVDVVACGISGTETTTREKAAPAKDDEFVALVDDDEPSDLGDPETGVRFSRQPTHAAREYAKTQRAMHKKETRRKEEKEWNHREKGRKSRRDTRDEL
ncbi:Aste57867_3385 [Aphanomyces stellatus]|uniref:Aste57867_3385 protein n=1 Tax=Aphanomyces stellatus TaxID=120398 RepID=A0A485KBZ5_9STRA|nr:hypothetical protein As57867_003375 [Aphanomyces stellatus]VFT80551.1 Aste57867_3385 [Aphanomyces stellatus]